jgi:hypothetical protein
MCLLYFFTLQAERGEVAEAPTDSNAFEALAASLVVSVTLYAAG